MRPSNHSLICRATNAHPHPRIPWRQSDTSEDIDRCLAIDDVLGADETELTKDTNTHLDIAEPVATRERGRPNDLLEKEKETTIV